MKKLFFSFVLISLLSLNALGQSPLGPDGNEFRLAGGYTNNGIPVFLSFEMGIPDVLDDITLGAEVGYRSFSEKTDSATLQHQIFGFTFFGNYYFNRLLNMDVRRGWFVYGGVNLGYYKWFSPEGYLEVGESSSTLAAGIQIGGKYYFKDWGIYLEGMGGTENFGGKLGVVYRFDY